MKWRRTLKIRRVAVAFGAVGLIVAGTAQARPDETLGPGYEAVQSSMSAASHYPPQALKAEGATLTAKAKALGGFPAASYYTPQALAAESARWTGQVEAYSTLEALKSDDIQTVGLRPDSYPGIQAVRELGEEPVQSMRPDNRAGIHSVDGLALYDTQDRIFAIADPEELVRNEPGYAPATPTESQPVQPVQSVRPDNRPGLHGPGQTFEPVSAPVNGGGFDWSDWAIGIASGLGATALVAAAALMPYRRKRKVTGRVVTSTS